MHEMQPVPEVDGLQPFEPRRDYRTLPDLALLKAVFWRNLPLGAVLLLLYAPFAAVAVLQAAKTFSSAVFLKFDASDEVDPEATQGPGASFAGIAAFLTEVTGDAEFYQELAHRYVADPPQSLLARLRLPSRIAAYVTPETDPATSPIALERKAKALHKQLALVADYELMRSSMIRLTATASTPEGAQRLAAVAGQLLTDQYYQVQAQRAATGRQSLASLLDNAQVKAMVEKAKAAAAARPASAGEAGSRPPPGRADQADQRRRQQELQDRIKDVNVRIGGAREQRQKLEAELTELAQRYGPFHPKIRALQSQLAGMAREGELSGELQALKDKYGTYEAQARSPEAPPLAEMPPENLEGVDKVVQKLATKMDRYNLEQINIEQQLKNPAQRLRLTLLGAPSLPQEPTSSKRLKAALLAAALGLATCTMLAVFREFLSEAARDPWRITWRFQLPCLATFSRKTLQAPPRLDAEEIGRLAATLLSATRPEKALNTLTTYRQLTHWLHTSARGRVILFAKSSDQPGYGRFLGNVANVYSSDYAGRCLVLDFDARDAAYAATEGAALAPGSILDFLARQVPWKDVCRPRDALRAFDVLAAPTTADARLPELVSAPILGEFLAMARKTYKTILIFGLGPEQFVENSSLAAHATDCVIVVDGRTSTFGQVDKLATHLDPAKLRGFVYADI